jgi:hypothetical protein
MACMRHILKAVTDFRHAQGLFIEWKYLLLLETLK